LLALVAALPAALLFAASVWIYFTNNWHPPAQYARLFASGHLTHIGEVDKDITEILNTRFPKGTPVSDLKSALYKEGFRDLPPPEVGCVEPSATAGLQPPITICTHNENTMLYRWAIGLVCGGSIYARWYPDQNSKITGIKGGARTACS
jgi:hypothetical protein